MNNQDVSLEAVLFLLLFHSYTSISFYDYLIFFKEI